MPDTLLGGIAINEVLVDPNSSGGFNTDTDGSGVARGGDEYLELVNTSGSAIDISGLELWDAGRGNWFTFPPGTVLEAGAHAVVVRNVQNGGNLPATTGDNLAFDADFGGGVFNNGRDNIVVYDPANDEYIQATYNGDTLDDPPNDYAGFSGTATRSGSGEDLGNDVDGRSIQRASTGFDNDETPTPGGPNICFTGGTPILTPRGFVAVEALRPGDLVVTQDAGLQAVAWVFSRDVSVAEARADPALWPVSIKGPAGGSLRVSRHHRIAVRGPAVARMFAAACVLAPAKDLLGLPDVRAEAPKAPFRYVHLLLEGHHILSAGGIAVESLLLGPQAWDGMSDGARADLHLLFPDGLPEDLHGPERSGDVLAMGRRVRSLVAGAANGSTALSFDFAGVSALHAV
ncbi:Hint domain-containing protein [Hasllibacter sp. MH4015]|uniref:Hint domain-containing protein n=1 Tax=Hasllibacter sp. MH4015 TaxID=2854029 RepID=UPI001CD68041|nr:Hint domain-containing protein [Hasllibacter sp. MH4015]